MLRRHLHPVSCDRRGAAQQALWSAERRPLARRTSTRDCDWALGELQLGLNTHDLAHLISHMATTLQRVSLKAEISGQYASAIGAQRLLYDLLVSRRLDADAKKAEHNGWGDRRGTARR